MIRPSSLIACAMAVLLAGCAGARGAAPLPAIQTVEVPTPVRCRPDLGPEPNYPDTEQALRAAPDLYARVRLLLAGRLLRIARDQQKTAALMACAG